jgi:NAD(P)-dependent dehydrogenase (short-subunit alcohol dehydrogenase family)
MTRLKNKVAVITGGSGGIGLAAGKIFALEGAKVLLVDLDEEILRHTVEGIDSDAVDYTVADVTRPEQVQRYIDTAADRFGAIDIFVANAGITGDVMPIAELPVDNFDKVMAVNVRGVWLGIKYVIPQIQKRGGGSIVITSSVAGLRGGIGMSAYVASKHAVIGIMRSVAIECGPMGIRVNTVNPGPIDTSMVRSLESSYYAKDPQRSKKVITSATALKRYGTPEEVAALMLFLAGDESRYCTGGVYTVDGGLTA